MGGLFFRDLFRQVFLELSGHEESQKSHTG
jgi:hypothetical protein